MQPQPGLRGLAGGLFSAEGAAEGEKELDRADHEAAFRWIWACGGDRRALCHSGMEHHVYFWLKEEYQNDVDRAIFEQGLAALFDITLVAGGRWAVPAKVMIRPVIDQSWDYALTMQFKNIEDHDAYQVDADHDVFINTFKDWWAKVQVRDLA